MTQDHIRYSELIDNAMRGVVKSVLRKVQAGGLPGQHHFYITFATTHPGVVISGTLKTRYPTEMTVVLQHQFWDFKVEEHYFTATLSFGGVPERLVIPFAAIVAFADPSIKFGLQFQTKRAANEPQVPAPTYDNAPEAQEESAAAPAAEAASDTTAEIISLDAFRQKK